MPVVAGTRIGPYEILRTIGAGGMGEVYRARDLRLDRDVAVKVLPDHLAQNLEFRARFAREARAVAALSHPNILTIHDFGVDRGVPYAVTELLEGETLREALDRGPIPWRRALEFGVLLAEGLSAAHGRGIVHRDLKPENVFLTSGSQLKILDFGLAQLESGTAPREDSGVVMGTFGYMSPEQIRGEKAEPSTDIFALGCVLYEMLSGRRAFPQTTLKTILDAILKGGLPDVCDLDRSIPLQAGRLVARCIESKSDARYHSARDLAFHLREILASPGTRAEPEKVTSLAVIPFACERLAGESEYLSDGLTESIINHLTRLRQLRVAARSVVFRYKGKDADCLAVARDLNVDAVLTGRLTQRGEHLQIQAELTRAADGTQIWGQRFNRKLADIFEVEEQIGRDISEALRLELTGKEVEQLGKRYTHSTSAYQCYLQGRYLWNKRSPDSLTKGIEHFSEAIARDPDYALAYCGLADSYGMLSMYRYSRPQDVVPQAIGAARKAVEIDPNLAEAQASLAFWTMNYEWTWKASEAAFERAIELDPQYATARQWYSAMLLCRGRFEEALGSAKAAVVLDPLSLSGNAALGWVYHFSRRYEEAIEQYRKTLEIDPGFLLAYHFLAMSYEQKGMYEDAIAACQHAAKLPGGIAVLTGGLVHTYAKAGRLDKARKFLEELLRRRETTYVPAYDLAIIYAGMNEPDQAFAWLSEACNERSTWLTCARLDPRLDGLRDDPRFSILLRRVGLA